MVGKKTAGLILVSIIALATVSAYITGGGMVRFSVVDSSKIYLQPKFDVYKCEPVGSAVDYNYTGAQLALAASDKCPSILGIQTLSFGTVTVNQNTNQISVGIKPLSESTILSGIIGVTTKSGFYRVNNGQWIPFGASYAQNYITVQSNIVPSSQVIDFCLDNSLSWGATQVSPAMVAYSYQPYGLRKYSGMTNQVVDFTSVKSYPSCNLQALNPADGMTVCVQDPTGKYCTQTNSGVLGVNQYVNAWSGGYGLGYLPADIKTLPSGLTGICNGNEVDAITKITLADGEQVQTLGDKIATYGAGQNLECCPDSRGINTVCDANWKWKSLGSTADTCQTDSQCKIGASVVFDSGTYDVQPSNPLVGIMTRCTAGKCDYTHTVALTCSPYAPGPQGKVCCSDGTWCNSIIGSNVTRPITTIEEPSKFDWLLIISLLIVLLSGLIAYAKNRDKVWFAMGLVAGVVGALVFYFVVSWILANPIIVALGAFGVVLVYLIGAGGITAIIGFVMPRGKGG